MIRTPNNRIVNAFIDDRIIGVDVLQVEFYRRKPEMHAHQHVIKHLRASFVDIGVALQSGNTCYLVGKQIIQQRQNLRIGMVIQVSQHNQVGIRLSSEYLLDQ